ncbi:MAG: glycine cleavage system protein GcvH [Anaerolineaceae bacterium]|nr:glycine cleavage system protein GcvH [Anaerolineaceae bacterium]
MKIESGLLYSKNDEWVRIEGDTATIGITDYAQSQLSDIVFAEVSIEADESVEAGDCIGTVESVKAASDIYTPVSGTVAAINEAVADEPEIINKDAFGTAWFIKVKVDGPVDKSELMDAAAYEKYCEEREH